MGDEELRQQKEFLRESGERIIPEKIDIEQQNKMLLEALISRVKSHFEDLENFLPFCDGELIDFFKDDITLIESIKNKPWDEIIKE